MNHDLDDDNSSKALNSSTFIKYLDNKYNENYDFDIMD